MLIPQEVYTALQETEKSYQSDSAMPFNSDQTRQSIGMLLQSLVQAPDAFRLPSSRPNVTLAEDLFDLYIRNKTATVSYEPYHKLAQLVLKHAPDTDIWDAVVTVILKITSTTSISAPIPPEPAATPTKSTSKSQQGSEQTNRLLKESLFGEFRHCTYRKVDGFFSKYFDNKKWTKRSIEIYSKRKSRHSNGIWTDFPSPPDETAVWDWFNIIQNEYLSDAPNAYYTTKSTKDLAGGESRRQLDLLVGRRNHLTDVNRPHSWENMLAIGEHKKSQTALKELLLQLGGYVREAFIAQPNRRFFHGFFLHSTTLELWVFDRSGPFSSGPFDINEEPEQFIRAITGYLLMSDEELGLDTFVERTEKQMSISTKHDTGASRIFNLVPTPIAKQNAIVCRGTNCYLTTDSKHVAKFSWASDRQSSEANLLKIANERGVVGIPTLVAYHRITSTTDLRTGLGYGAPYRFKETKDTTPQLNPLSPTTSAIKSLNLAVSPLKEAMTLMGSPEQNKSPEFARTRAKTRAQTKSETESNENSQNSNNLAHNRIFGCIVIRPSGKPIQNFESIQELLKVLYDAITAHRSLYLKGRILHRDISENNIIITKQEDNGGMSGMLIDLDLAVEKGKRTGAAQITGTTHFMAIEVLRGLEHTYRHDLESFLYLLLWLCARRAWDKGVECQAKKTSNLVGWYTGSFTEIAHQKVYHMGDGFESVLSYFPSAFERIKPFCGLLRKILFPRNLDGKLFIGTPADEEELYGPILKAFEDATEQLLSQEE